MFRKAMRAVLCAALGMAALMLAFGAVTAQDKKDAKTIETKDIMQKSFKAKDNLKTTISAAVKDGKWDDAKKLAKDWTELCAGFSKNKPPKGEAKDWEANTKKFTENTKAILDATEKKDAAAAEKALKGFDCMGCHKAHRP